MVALLVVWLLSALYPVFFLVLTSFRTDVEIMATPFTLPKRLLTDNWIAVFEGGAMVKPISRLIVNSSW